MSDLTYSEQIQAEVKKSHKMRDMARLFYYTQLSENSCASASYESFKGSWAHSQWIAKHGPEIERERDSKNRRFGWNGMWV